MTLMLCCPHFQFRISGRSCPYLSMYSLCSTSLSLRLLLQVDALVACLRKAADRVHNKVKAIQVVKHSHVEGVVMVPSSL